MCMHAAGMLICMAFLQCSMTVVQPAAHWVGAHVGIELSRFWNLFPPCMATSQTCQEQGGKIPQIDKLNLVHRNILAHAGEPKNPQHVKRTSVHFCTRRSNTTTCGQAGLHMLSWRSIQPPHPQPPSTNFVSSHRSFVVPQWFSTKAYIYAVHLESITLGAGVNRRPTLEMSEANQVKSTTSHDTWCYGSS